jgi:hypothetical protein
MIVIDQLAWLSIVVIVLGQDVEKIGIERPLHHENSDPTTIYSRFLQEKRIYYMDVLHI